MNYQFLHSIIKAGINRNQSIYLHRNILQNYLASMVWAKMYYKKSVEDRVVAYLNIDS
jgi:hypothetical protein